MTPPIFAQTFTGRSDGEVCTISRNAAGAAWLAVELITMVKSRRRRGLEDAFRVAANKTGIGYWHFRDWWKGRTSKRECADVLNGTWEALVTAYQIECVRQLRIAQHRLQHARTL